ncbi:SDR family oxidoreductase [Eubacteriales bacterium OttesenSCG-928-A19]|nr:SDR family oxidoreductase [Eubacteriales bacterium OttesenSCG-928-A19]
MELHGKRALVTGASSGIGRAVALALAEHGVSIVLQGRDEARLHALRERIEREEDAPPTAVIAADLTDEQAANTAVDRAASAFGGLEILVHCAGVSQRRNMPFAETDTEGYRRILSTNVDGAFYCMRRALSYLREAEEGYIVNILSTAATSAGKGGGVYAASKHATRALQEALVAECRGTGVRVSSVSPGPVATEIWTHKTTPPSEAEKQTMLRPETIADIVVFLLCQDANVFIPDVRVEPWMFGQ